jgi:hypothetical protein
MLQYVFNTDLDDDEPMMFSAYDQCWDKATLKQLKEEYDIIFMTSGDAVMPIMIVDKDSEYPLFVIGTEDDGTIQFERECGQFKNCFSPYWCESLIADLKAAIEHFNYEKKGEK